MAGMKEVVILKPLRQSVKMTHFPHFSNEFFRLLSRIMRQRTNSGVGVVHFWFISLKATLRIEYTLNH